jgi:hypothetical protein
MRIVLSLCTVTLLSSAAWAQPLTGVRQDRRELAQDRREIAQDKRQINDDARDARRFTLLLRELDGLRAAGNLPGVSAVEQRVLAALDDELREANRETAQKSAEATRSAGEVRRDRREVAGDVARGRPGRAADDVRDLNRDRRNLADDRRDLAIEVAQGQRVQAIRTEYAALAGRMEPASLDRKRALLAEVVGLQRAEVRNGVQELREDRRERREDRRELREDRRQR